MAYGGYRSAEEQWKAETRKRSPKFPDVNEILRRRQRQRETITARSLLVLTALSLSSAPWVGSSALIIAGFCFTGFAITCLVAGGRAHTEGETL